MCAVVEGAHGYVLWCTQVHIVCVVVHIGMCWRGDWLVTLVVIGILQVVIQLCSGCLWVGWFWTFEKSLLNHASL